MQKYQLAVIFDYKITEEEKEKINSRIKKIIEEAKGTIENVDDWGKKAQAYPLGKQEEGYYEIFYFSGEAAVAIPVEKKITLEEKILRHLLVKTPA
jgi:small subunit ribosomal protein S6